MWLLHAALEGPISFIALFFTHSLQFKDEITNTMAVVIKVRRSPLHPIPLSPPMARCSMF